MLLQSHSIVVEDKFTIPSSIEDENWQNLEGTDDQHPIWLGDLFTMLKFDHLSWFLQ